MSRLTWDGTAEPVSRDQTLRHAQGQGNVHSPCSADHEQDLQPYPVNPYSCFFYNRTYIHTYILLLYAERSVRKSHEISLPTLPRNFVGMSLEYPFRDPSSGGILHATSIHQRSCQESFGSSQLITVTSFVLSYRKNIIDVRNCCNCHTFTLDQMETTYISGGIP